MDSLTPKIEFSVDSLTVFYVREYGFVERLIEDYRRQGYTVRSLHIVSDCVDHLDVPDGVEELIATRVGLKSVKIPSSLKYMYVSDNFLQELILPVGSMVQLIDAKHNCIERFVCLDGAFPSSLLSVKLKNNRLRELMYERSKSLFYLDIRFQNQFITLDKIHPSLLVTVSNEEFECRHCQFDDGLKETWREAC